MAGRCHGQFFATHYSRHAPTAERTATVLREVLSGNRARRSGAGKSERTCSGRSRENKRTRVAQTAREHAIVVGFGLPEAQGFTQL